LVVKDYVQIWFEHLRGRRQASIPARIEILGEYNKHTGPAWPRAAVRLVVEPAEAFEVVDEVEKTDDLEQFAHPDYVMIGLLSMLMTASSMPILKIRVTLKEVKIDPIETTRMAFEMAGRDAGRKILAAMKQS
jgi:hypothetical protein